MKALLFSNEFPPNVYGGAGVHVDYLSRELAKLMPVEVRCFGEQDEARENLRVQGFDADKSGYTCPKPIQSVFATLQRDLNFNTQNIDADVVHCHTWYAHFAGILAKLNYGIPLVITTHSLEPLRPWKREQLGRGYDFSSWVEKTALEMADAVIAVSEGTKRDIERLFNVQPDRLRVIYNGIDPEEYSPVKSTAALEKHGVDTNRPYVLFVGRVTRQKGIVHLVRAIHHMDKDFQVVLCAGAPDTPEIAEEMTQAVREVSAQRKDVIWIQEMLDKPSVIEFYTHASIFCCPSIYEPFGIINLEAMACETPVVAASVGGIPEVVVDGETGYLVPLKQSADGTPVEPESYSKDLASAVNRLMRSKEQQRKFSQAGRQCVLEKFSWPAIAQQTKALYEELGS